MPKFLLRPKYARAALTGLTARLLGTETSLPIALTQGGSFELPRNKQLQDEEY